MSEENSPWSWQFKRWHLIIWKPSVMTQTVGNKPQADDTIVARQKWDIRPNWKHQMLHSLHSAVSKASTWLQQGNSLAASGAHLCSCTFIRELPHAKLHKSLRTVCPQVDIWFRPDLVTLLSNFSRIHQVFESRFLLSGKSGLPVELVGGLNSVLGSSGLTPQLAPVQERAMNTRLQTNLGHRCWGWTTERWKATH